MRRCQNYREADILKVQKKNVRRKNYKKSQTYISIYIGVSMSGLIRQHNLVPQKTYLVTVSVELKKCEGNKEEEKP